MTHRHAEAVDMKRQPEGLPARQIGFTLIEVTLALLVLGGSLVVLLGLQSSIIERTLRDSQKQRAMLLSRRIFSAIESSKNPPPAQKTEGSFRDVLGAVTSGSSDSIAIDPEDQQFSAQLDVEEVDIPNIAEKAMRKITLSIAWGPKSIDQLTAVYFTQGD